MNVEQKALRIGILAIALAAALRLAASGIPAKLLTAMTRPETAAAVLFLQTGRVVRPQAPTPAPEPTPEPPEETEPAPAEETALPVFSGEDAALVSVNNSSGYSIDPKALLGSPLSWDLTGEAPTVLIVHTHGTESYQNTEGYKESSQYRTRDIHYNVVSVGARVKTLLEEAGISVLHDTAMHDDPNYTGSYSNSRKSIQSYLKEYPSIRLVLDIHRDSVEGADGKQKRYILETEHGAAAQVMLVIGTDAGGLKHPNWQKNLSLGVKLHAQLEKEYPGLCRAISFRPQRFNQDLTEGSLLLEMGSAGNTREEALLSARLVAEAIVTLSKGTG